MSLPVLHQGKALNIVGRSLSSVFDPPAKIINEMPGEMFQVRNSRLVAHRVGSAFLDAMRRIGGGRLQLSTRFDTGQLPVRAEAGPLTFRASHCAPPAAEAWERATLRCRHVSMASRYCDGSSRTRPPERFQKLRTQIFRQHHPVRPARAHALGWSRRSAARALSHVSSRRTSPVLVDWTVWELMLREVARVHMPGQMYGVMVSSGQRPGDNRTLRRPTCAACTGGRSPAGLIDSAA